MALHSMHHLVSRAFRSPVVHVDGLVLVREVTTRGLTCHSERRQLLVGSGT